ncbi:hypothetical protein R6Q59_004558 [Mikania micrantha]
MPPLKCSNSYHLYLRPPPPENMFIPAGKHLLWIFLTFTHLINTVTVAQPDFRYYVCGDGDNYTRNSTYQRNLDTTLSELPLTNSGLGFFNLSSGQGNNRVNSAALCQGDMEPDLCLACINDSIIKLREVCPNQKEAVGYYGRCLLKYSDAAVTGNIQTNDSGIVINVQSASNVDQFIEDLDSLMDKLKADAAAGGSLLKFATGNTTTSDFMTIYGLVQCTPDLSGTQCSDCLEFAHDEYVASGSGGKIGGTIFLPTCRYSYDIQRFFNGSTLVIPAPPPPILQATPPVLPPPPPPAPAPAGISWNIIIVIIVVTFGVIIIAFVCIFLRMRKRKQKPMPLKDNDDETMDIDNAEPLKYNFNMVRAATNNFSEDNKLGQGGFGAVYKGMLADGREIAVKRLARDSGQGEAEFKNEVLLVARLRHRNLVRLLGFSLKGCERLLVYELLPNGSLDQFIFDPIRRTVLDWQKRYNIIKGISRGLRYLHEESRLMIIHRDMKPSNILLDSIMTPKIADFGMARLFNDEESQGQATRIVGTYGYMAPEYALYGQFSVKSDVFSFGVLILEMLTGQKNQCFENEESSKYLLGFVWECWQNGTTTNIIDPTLKTRSGLLSDIIRSIHIGLLCVQDNANDRPTMLSVVLMFDSQSLPLPTPSKPVFFGNSNTNSWYISSTRGSSCSEKPKISNSTLPSISINDVSISDIVIVSFVHIIVSFVHVIVSFMYVIVSFMFLLNVVYYVCGDGDNYTRNSTYQRNLDTTLSELPLTNSGLGFFNLSSGQGNNRVNSAALCQGDMEPDLCLACINDSIIKLREVCPNQKEAVGYYGRCLLKYSDAAVTGNIQTNDSGIVINVKSASNVDQFIGALDSLMDKLKADAAAGGSLLKFATGNTTTSDFMTIYGLVQCTPDLSGTQCSDCLEFAHGEYVASGSGGKIGGTIFLPTCRYSYDIQRFFNGSTLVIPAPPPPILQATPPVLPPPPPPPAAAPAGISWNIIIVIIVVTFGVIIIAFVCIFLRMRKRKQKPMPLKDNDDETMDIDNAESLKYNFNMVRAATNNFSEDNKLGQGGFGAVYKGMLADGREIAVKRLARDSGQGEAEFKNEVLLVARLQHRNLVRLLGFSLKGCERLLVYELLPNGSLDQFIFDPIRRTLLDWQKRYNIIKGISRGLLYLHEESRLMIIHRDMKASNILLDSKMTPKIADFGMARLFNDEESQGQATRIVGTYGYMAPEYALYGQFSVKSDVFSFGVLILEMLTGQKNQCFENEESSKYLLGFVWECWQNGTTTNIIDSTLKTRSGSLSDIIRSIHIGLLCVQDNANDRPTMSSVVLMFDSQSLPLPTPSKPAFFGNTNTNSWYISSTRGSSCSEKPKISNSTLPSISINDVSISDIVPR